MQMDVDRRTYCICNSKDETRFMICCDSCNTWFHGECVNQNSEEAKKIKHYYCAHCCTRKGLSIEYKQKVSGTPVHSESESEVTKKRSKKDCGICIGCFRTEDCGRCDVCKANKELEQNLESSERSAKVKCRLRRCVNADAPTVKHAARKKEIAKNKEGSVRMTASGAKLKNLSKKKSFSMANYQASLSSNFEARQGVKMSPDAGFDRRPSVERSSSTSAGGVGAVGTTRAGARAYKSFMVDAGVLPRDAADGDRSSSATSFGSDDVLRQCQGPGCVLPARRGSKYCSDETCGLRLARARLMEILPGRIQQWKANPCMAEEFEKQRLEQIDGQMLTARQKLSDLTDEEEKLTKWLEESKNVKWDGQQEAENDEEEGNNVYCPTCGHETSAKAALRHISRCFSKHTHVYHVWVNGLSKKYENLTSFGSSNRTLNNVYNLFCDTYNKSSHTYCKRLRVVCPEHHKEPKVEDENICASPLAQNLTAKMDSFDSASCCKAQKKACTRHYKWDKMRRALIDSERLALLLRLDELYDEQRALRAASNARGGLLALLLHQTVKHDDSNDPSTLPLLQTTPATASPPAVQTTMTSTLAASSPPPTLTSATHKSTEASMTSVEPTLTPSATTPEMTSSIEMALTPNVASSSQSLSTTEVTSSNPTGMTSSAPSNLPPTTQGGSPTLTDQ